MSYVLLVIVLLTQFNSVCSSALSIGDWQLAVSSQATGQLEAELNTNAGFYDLENVNTCYHDKYSDIVAQDADNWVSIDEWKEFGLGLEKVPNIPVDMNNADIRRWESPVADLTINEGGVEKQITATIGFGHGVAELKCGDCFLLETSGTDIPENSWIHNNDDFTDLLAYDKLTRYAVIRTVDVATDSLEISDPSLYYLLPLTGRIDYSTQPKYQSVDCKAVMSAVVTGTRTATSTTTTTTTTSSTTTVSKASSTTTTTTTNTMTTTESSQCTDAQLPIAWSGGGVHTCSTYEQLGGTAYCAHQALAEACCFCKGSRRLFAPTILV